MMDNSLTTKEICLANAESRFLTPRRQRFSMPYNLIGYLMKEWTPLTYYKLLQTCKYFFSVHRLVLITQPAEHFQIDALLFTCLQKGFKVWLYGTLECGSNISVFLRTVHLWALDFLDVSNHRMTFTEYKLILSISTLEVLHLSRGTHVTDDHDVTNIFPLDALVKPLRNVEEFYINASILPFNNEAMKRLADASISDKLECLLLDYVPEFINFEHLYRLGMNTSLIDIRVLLPNYAEYMFYGDAKNHTPLKTTDWENLKSFEHGRKYFFENFVINAGFF